MANWAAVLCALTAALVLPALSTVAFFLLLNGYAFWLDVLRGALSLDVLHGLDAELAGCWVCLYGYAVFGTGALGKHP